MKIHHFSVDGKNMFSKVDKLKMRCFDSALFQYGREKPEMFENSDSIFF